MRTSRTLAPEEQSEPGAAASIRNSDRLAAAQPRSRMASIVVRARPDSIHVAGETVDPPAERLRRELEELAYSAELL